MHGCPTRSRQYPGSSRVFRARAQLNDRFDRRAFVGLEAIARNHSFTARLAPKNLDSVSAGPETGYFGNSYPNSFSVNCNATKAFCVFAIRFRKIGEQKLHSPAGFFRWRSGCASKRRPAVAKLRLITIQVKKTSSNSFRVVGVAYAIRCQLTGKRLVFAQSPTAAWLARFLSRQ